MAQPLPPTGSSASTATPGDPWQEQRRREEAHRAAARRRRRRWLLRSAALIAVAVAVGATIAVVVRRDRADEAAPTLSTAPTVAPSTTEVEVVPPPTVPPDRLVEVSEVWLLDRGDEVFDWGLSVVVPETGPTRSGVEVTVTLFDDADEIVDTIVRTLDGVNSLVPSTAAGRLEQPDRAPTRLEFDITVGFPSDDLALDALLGTRAVRRDGDELTGRIRSSARTEITDISMVVVWRADDADESEGPSGRTAGEIAEGISPGDVIAVVVYDIERIRPGIDALFTIDLDEQRAPDGLPDDVLWSPTS